MVESTGSPTDAGRWINDQPAWQTTAREMRESIERLVQRAAEEMDISLEGGGPYSAAYNQIIRMARESWRDV